MKSLAEMILVMLLSIFALSNCSDGNVNDGESVSPTTSTVVEETDPMPTEEPQPSTSPNELERGD